jgi:hypothetical protein
MSHARAESKQSSSSPSSKKDSEERGDSPASTSFTRGQGPLRTGAPAVEVNAGDRSTQNGRSTQPKLTVNEPNNKYEREAERVADAVMRMPEPGSTEDPQENVLPDRIQRMCPRCQRRHRQGKPLNCEDCEQEMQRRDDRSSGSDPIAGSAKQAARVTEEPGQPLPDRTQSFFEARMGRSFSDVRIHTGGKADRAARSIDAKAYTLGNDVVLRSDEYRPETRSGRRLLAHELTHVVQQHVGKSSEIQRQDAGDEEEPAQGVADERNGRPQQQDQQEQDQQQGQQDEEENEARQEWDAHPGIHHHFHCFEGCEGYAYADIRPVYQIEGVDNPAEFITNNIVRVDFLDQSTAVHQDLVNPLGQVESDLQDDPPNINRFGGFVPRRGGDGLSNHGLGRAVDVDSTTNPFIRSDADINVIEEVTGVDLGADQDQATLRQASNTFQQTFDDEWVQQKQDRLNEVEASLEELNNAKDGLTDEKRAQKAELESEKSELNSLLADIRTRRGTLDDYAEEGFLNLSEGLVDAFINNGFEWGGDWTNEKDFMHFEIDPP